MTTESPRWFKSSYSNNDDSCIEIATGLAAPRGIVPVRDSKNPSGPVLHFDARAFASFVADVKTRGSSVL
ncbi:DUF397 domain-containing protein [Streptomyces sp. NPDC002908]|uniref:DUF397 domain-containing protein n=1 Tax=Streptomyces sp. NPDC002908 TaxID=3364670 RepID=UPI00369F168F